MNQASVNYLRTFIIYVLLPFALVKLLYAIVSLLFLQKTDIQTQHGKPPSYHYTLHFAPKVLMLHGAQPAVKQIEATDRIKDITLKGTYLEGERSFIVIEDRLGTTFLSKGERYVGYQLEEIYEGRAVFSKNGRHYDLVIEDEEKTPAAPHATGASNYSGGGNVGENSFEPVSVTHEMIDSYIKNPAKIWRNIRIQEIRRNGQIDGFRVNYVKKGSFFDQAGLRSGDIIKAIDGNELKSLADVMRYYNDIQNLSGLTLTVLRGGNEVELEFNIN